MLSSEKRRTGGTKSPPEAWQDEFSVEPISSGFSNSLNPRSSQNCDRRSKFGIDNEDTARFHSPQTPQRNVVEGLRAWSESPTSPRQRAALEPKRVNGQEERENWDDDFLDSTDSPAKPSASDTLGRHRAPMRTRAIEDLEEENWDEDFEMGVATSSSGLGPSARSKRSRRGKTLGPAWDSSEDEMEDFDREMGFDRNDEEDKTVTSRSRRKPLGLLSNEPIPPLPKLPPLPSFLPTIPLADVPGPYASPPSPFPRSSPSHSVFSIPATTTSGGQRDRDSSYGSTAHLALSLRRTHSAESSPTSPLQQKFINPNRFPQGSNFTPRERRRLRKKSRPPHLDSSILELDDRAVAESVYNRPSTPDSRPCTPSPSTNATTALPPVTPYSSAQPSSTPPVPLSPTSASKSPLLARIGSIRRWGRKRASTTTGAESSSGLGDQNVRSLANAAPPSSFSTRVHDAESDRFDNNKTPRPRSHAANPEPSPFPALPVLQFPDSSLQPGSTQTPSRHHFFRSSPTDPRFNITTEVQDVIRAKSREREDLRVTIPHAVPMTAQSSQSGDSEAGLTASPRRARIRAFGQKFIAKRSASASSPERGKDSSDGSSSRMSMHGPSHRQVSTPLSGETPTRLRPRLPGGHQGPSALGSGRSRPVVPRHFSGSAVKEAGTRLPYSPNLGASGRSFSASGSTGTAPSSEDLSRPDKGLDEKAGHRGFMGSLRRISLQSAHSLQRQQDPTSDQGRSQSPVASVPPVPPIPPRQDARSTKEPISAAPSTVDSVQVDLASPTSNLSHNWPSSMNQRRSGEIPVLAHSKSSSFATSSSLSQSAPVSRLGSTSQVASLGRASPLPSGVGYPENGAANGSANVFRRSSLGDLKIPSRISRAQDGLKRDLGRVREFAARVEEMQELRGSYFAIATQVQAILDAPRLSSRATSPTGGLFGLSRSNSRHKSSTNPPPPSIDYRGLVAGFHSIDKKYSIAWECADLLIELGTGNVPESAPVMTQSDAATSSETNGRNETRERGATLSEGGKAELCQGDTKDPKSPLVGAPPPLVSWRSAAGRHDLAHRQLFLLREMLNNAESAKDGTQLDIPDTSSQWGETDEAMDSTLTLPTDESAVTNPPPGTPKKKRTSRLIGIRDMLRSLKRSTARALQNQHETTVGHSSTTLDTESSFDTNTRPTGNHPYGYSTVSGIPSHHTNIRRKSETSAALIESMRSPDEDYDTFAGKLLTHKSSPRRPSLASLFRLGQRQKPVGATGSPDRSCEHPETSVDVSGAESRDQADASRETLYDDIDDSDWDRMDSTSDVDAQLAAIADESSGRGSTMKLRKRKQQNRLSMPPTTLKHQILPFNSSQGSFASQDQSLTNLRSPRLSNVDENDVNISCPGTALGSGRQTPETSRRPRSRAGRDKDREKQSSSMRAIPQKHPNKAIPSFDPSLSSLLPGSQLKLAMTPENIKPLLENARVVTSRLRDCLAEVKGLLLRTEGAAVSLTASVA